MAGKEWLFDDKSLRNSRMNIDFNFVFGWNGTQFGKLFIIFDVEILLRQEDPL
jgi:hypothetical protein